MENRFSAVNQDGKTPESRPWQPAYDRLVAIALQARQFAYAPYSGFTVGAALATKDGAVFSGCNIENAAYPVGICAERTAFSKAVSEGKRDFAALVIVGAAADRAGSDFCSPCGLCRQFIREFCDGDFPIILVRADETGSVLQYKIYRLDELLPDSFGPENLNR